jgi:hypothetical protein
MYVCMYEDGPCGVETCRVVVKDKHEIGIAEPGTVWKAALETMFACIYQHQHAGYLQGVRRFI